MMESIIEPLKEQGRPKKDGNNVSNTNFKASDCDSPYLIGRIKRDRPDVAEKLAKFANLPHSISDSG